MSGKVQTRILFKVNPKFCSICLFLFRFTTWSYYYLVSQTFISKSYRKWIIMPRVQRQTKIKKTGCLLPRWLKVPAGQHKEQDTVFYFCLNRSLVYNPYYILIIYRFAKRNFVLSLIISENPKSSTLAKHLTVFTPRGSTKYLLEVKIFYVF